MYWVGIGIGKSLGRWGCTTNTSLLSAMYGYNTKWYLRESVSGVHLQDIFLSGPDWGSLTKTNDVVYEGTLKIYLAHFPAGARSAPAGPKG